MHKAIIIGGVYDMRELSHQRDQNTVFGNYVQLTNLLSSKSLKVKNQGRHIKLSMIFYQDQITNLSIEIGINHKKDTDVSKFERSYERRLD